MSSIVRISSFGIHTMVSDPTREELMVIEAELIAEAEEELASDEEAEALEWEIQYELEYGRT